MRTPGLADWVAGSGLTAQEHAKIQPAYCDCPDDEAPVCGVDGNTYLNECYAVTCAMVEVDHAGACAGEPTTGWPEPGTSGSGDSTAGGDTGGETADVPGDSSGHHDTDDHATDDHASDDVDDDDGDDDDKGCSIAGGREAPRGLALL
ncbi:MAG: hypothetical protein IAG13_36955, partial [Deltaproteobacteria bacterium]|nr:hypothetical protein [Nannocystaceae bacterium]